MKLQTCCFTGHRKIFENTDTIKLKLKREIIKLINDGVIYFGCGGAIGFDTLAAETVLDLKQTYPHIKLILVLPCNNHTEKWNEKDKKAFQQIIQHADKVRILAPNYYKGCMHKRNRHLVDNSCVCVCYKRKNYGGTSYTHNYAVQKGVRVIEI